MNYQKKPLSILEQIDKLQNRGLVFDDKDKACDYLSNISYYRLRAYTYPFQDNKDESADHAFLCDDIHFSDIIDLYCFDRRLRNLIFNAIEKIEVAVRAKVIQSYSEFTHNSHWFLDDTMYKDKLLSKNGQNISAYRLLMNDINVELKRNVKLPYNTKFSFIDKYTINHIRSNKIFALLCCIKYLSDVISPGNDLKKNLFLIMDDGGKLLSYKDMGFHDKWREFPIWKS